MLQLPHKTNSTHRPIKRVATVDRAGDARLWKLHDRFCAEQIKLQELDTPAAKEGSGANASNVEKRAFEKWEAQLDVVDRLVKRIAACPAKTLDGMLIKIQVTGFLMEFSNGTYKFRPYTDHNDLWVGHNPKKYFSEKNALIISLRDDLLRMRQRA